MCARAIYIFRPDPADENREIIALVGSFCVAVELIRLQRLFFVLRDPRLHGCCVYIVFVIAIRCVLAICLSIHWYLVKWDRNAYQNHFRGRDRGSVAKSTTSSTHCIVSSDLIVNLQKLRNTKTQRTKHEMNEIICFVAACEWLLLLSSFDFFLVIVPLESNRIKWHFRRIHFA